MKQLQSDNFWAHIEVIRRYQAPIMLRDHEGNDYVADTAGPYVMVLRCACGHVWELRRDQFPGRRKLRNCGRPECPYASGRAGHIHRYKERGSTCSVYLSTALASQVAAYADSQKISFSRGMERLVRAAFANGAVPGADFPGVTSPLEGVTATTDGP